MMQALPVQGVHAREHAAMQARSVPTVLFHAAGLLHAPVWWQHSTVIKPLPFTNYTSLQVICGCASHGCD